MNSLYSGMNKNQIRLQNQSYVYTIPKPVVKELGLEAGDEPDDVEWDKDDCKITLSF